MSARSRLVRYPTFGGGTVDLEIGPGQYSQARRWMIQYNNNAGSQWPMGIFFCTRLEAREYVKGRKNLRVVDCGSQNWDYMWDDSNTG